jgi:hypothetical protein
MRRTVHVLAVAALGALVASGRSALAQPTTPPAGTDSPANDRDPGAPPPTTDPPDNAPSEPDATDPGSQDPEPTEPAADVPDDTSVPQVTPPPRGPAPAPPAPGPTPITDEVAGVTSGSWRHGWRFGLHWQLLMLPEKIVALAFTPVRLVVAATEEYRLDRRLDDLLELADRRLVFAPRFKFSFGDGVGAGLWIKRPDLADQRAEVRLGGIVRLNVDWQVELEYTHALLLPGGRGLRAHAYAERDQNQRFYGLGGGTTPADKRVLRSDDQGAVVEIDLQGIDRYTYSGIARLGVRRQTLAPGVDAMTDPVGGDLDPVIPPAGFDERAVYIDATVIGRYDTRDTIARPLRGTLAAFGAHFRSDVTGKELSGVTLDGGISVHFPIIGDHRTVIVSLAGTAALPLFDGKARIPLDSLAVLGRSNVRGYDRERFRDRYGAVASLEYRFPLYEYLNSRAGLDAFTFVDVGEVWGTSPFAWSDVRYSLGGGLRGAHETKLGFQTTFGWSPEGYQINLGVESAL